MYGVRGERYRAAVYGQPWTVGELQADEPAPA